MKTIKINKAKTQIVINGQAYQKPSLTNNNPNQNKFIKFENNYYYIMQP